MTIMASLLVDFTSKTGPYQRLIKTNKTSERRKTPEIRKSGEKLNKRHH